MGDQVRLSELKNTFALDTERGQGPDVQRGGCGAGGSGSPQSQRNTWSSGLRSALILLGVMSLLPPGGCPGRPCRRSCCLAPRFWAPRWRCPGSIAAVARASDMSRTADGLAVLAQSLGFKQYSSLPRPARSGGGSAADFARHSPYAIVSASPRSGRKPLEEAVMARPPRRGDQPRRSGIGPGWGTGGFRSDHLRRDDFATQAAGTFKPRPAVWDERLRRRWLPVGAVGFLRRWRLRLRRQLGRSDPKGIATVSRRQSVRYMHTLPPCYHLWMIWRIRGPRRSGRSRGSASGATRLDQEMVYSTTPAAAGIRGAVADGDASRCGRDRGSTRSRVMGLAGSPSIGGSSG